MSYPPTRIPTVIVCILLLAACGEEQPAEQRLVGEITRHQGDSLLDRTHINFNFRDMHFEVRRFDGQFEYSRTFEDSTGLVRDMMDNDGVYRYVNGQLTEQTEKKINSIATDVNSVVYFALLPYPLNDPAVQPRYLGTDTVDGQEYETLEVTFAREGGGRDYEDRFIYWIHPDNSTIDYLAYYYHTDGGGARFRKAFNQRRVGGVLFADYHNYRAEPDTMGIHVDRFSDLFNSGAVELVSEIILDSIRVAVSDSMVRSR